MINPIKAILEHLDKGHFSIRTLDEAEELAVLLAHVAKEPERIVVGLRELLFNAIEHGNLGVTYQDKTRLNKRGEWYAEIKRRLELPEYRSKNVDVVVACLDREIHYLIQDEGPGFNWESYLELDPGRAFDTHGRGIAIASKMGFERLQYQGKGNTVLAVVQKNRNSY
jgi:anti-sigma regulatory factor (Ser/Thr protein kinase)